MHCSTRLAVLANFLGCSFIAISLLTRNTQLCHVQNEQVARSVESEHAHVNLPASATYLRGRHAAGFEDHVYSDLYIKHINDIKHMEKQVATGRTWRAHVAKVLQLPHVDEMRCGAGLLENLHFKKATPPRHFLPARRGNAHLSIFAELESDTCNLLGRDTKTGQTGCDKIESGARSGTGIDTWIHDFIDVALTGCKQESCLALDIGANLGIVSLRMLQAGAHVIAVEPQVDLCCAGNASAAFNGYRDHAAFLCGGVAFAEDGPTQLALQPGLFRYGVAGGQAFQLKAFYDRLGLPHSVPLYLLRSLVVEDVPLTFDFIKIDTDSVDCHIVRTLLDLQREGLMRFDSASFESWGDLCTDNEKFSQLLADLQADGYGVYRTDGNTRAQDLPQFAELTAEEVFLPTTSLLKFKKFSYSEWLAADKTWHRTYQMVVTKLDHTGRTIN